jgi:hypothetical protein
VASVNNETPSPEEARAALAEASRLAGSVGKSDDAFRLVLLIFAGVYIALGAAVGFPPSDTGHVAQAVVGGGTVCGAVLAFRRARMRASSRRGSVRFSVSIAAFSLWNAAAVAVSEATGWWGARQPGYHFTVTAVVAALPLVAAAWLIGRDRR